MILLHALLLMAWQLSPEAAPAPLTLRDAIEIGLRPGQRADTSLAGEAIARAASVAQANKLAMLPSLDVRASGGERSVNLGAQGFGGAGAGNQPFRLNPAFTTFDVRPTASFTLLNLAQWKAWKASQKDIGLATQERNATLDNAALAIANQYVLCLKAQAEVRAGEADVQLSEELLAAAEERRRAGTVTLIDVTRAKAQVAADRSGLIQQRQAEEEARAMLFRMIGLTADASLALGPIPENKRELLPEQATALAEASRADFRVRREAVQVAMEKAKAIGWEKFPTLSGSFDIGRNGNTPATNAWTRSATLNLGVTIYDFGRRKQKESQAEIAVREENIRLQDLRREIHRQVRVATGRIAAAQAQIEAAKAERELTVMQLDQVRERVKAGLSTGLDVTDAQTRLARSARSVLQAEFALQSADLELLHATGTLRQRIEEN